MEQHQDEHRHIMLDVDRLLLLGSLDVKKDASSSLLRHQQAVEVEEAEPQRFQLDLELDDGQQGGESASIECRICQEDDQRGNLEAPCACCGSLKYAHRKCVQRWCNEKGDTMCEICQQPFKSGYTAPVRPVHPQHRQPAPDDLRMWGQQLDFRDPRLIEIAERHILQGYDDYPVVNASGASCCRSAALILMALLLLRHTLALSTGSNDEDASTIFMLFLLRAAGFLLPCYIMARIMNILQRRRQRQEWNGTRSLSMLESWTSFRIPFVSSL